METPIWMMPALASLCIGCTSGPDALKTPADGFVASENTGDGASTSGPGGATRDGGSAATDLHDDSTGGTDLANGSSDGASQASDGAAQASDGGITPSLQSYPGLTPLQLSSDTVTRFFVANDEAHVAFSRGVAGGSFGCQGRIGLGDLSVAAIASGASTVQAIESSAGLNESGFSGDGKWIFYTQYDKTDPCTLGASVYKASTDGAQKNLLSGGGALSFKDITIQGGGAFWRAFGSSASDPGTLYAAAFANSSPTVDAAGGTLLSNADGTAGGLDPTGRALIYDANNKSILVQLASGVTVELSPAKLPVTYRSFWSPDGNSVALLSSSATSGKYSLSLLDHDGSNLRTVSAACDCTTVVWAPDSSRIIYDTTNTSSLPILVAHPIAGGADAQLGYPGDAPRGPSLYFQSSSRWLHVRYEAGFSVDTLLAGDVTKSGVLVHVTDTLHYSEASSGDLIATANYENATNANRVFSLDNQSVTTVLSGHAFQPIYEPTGASPRLAVVANFVDSTDVGDLELYSTDGAQLEVSLPGPAQVLPPQGSQAPLPFWLGRNLFYAINARNESTGEAVFDLVAAKDDGSIAGLVATRVRAVGWAQIAAPAKLFYSLSGAAGGGLFELTVP